MTDRPSKQTIELSGDLISRVENRLPYTEFESKRDYIECVLDEVLYYVESENDLEELEEIDDENVQEHLKALGYLNE